MLFTYKNHPVLEKLKTGKLGRVGVDQADEEMQSPQVMALVRELFNGKVAPLAKHTVKVVAKSLEEAIELAKVKLGTTENVDKILDDGAGTIILGELAFCYFIRNYEPDQLEYGFFLFNRQNVLLAIRYEDTRASKTDSMVSWSSKMIGGRVGDPDRSLHVFQELLSILLFLRYAPIVVKRLGANTKLKEISCKYVNQTEANIEIIDSTWFTTLVKSDAFKVRGHFRLQPFGPGLREKKLIWINEFEKQSYVRNFKRPLNLDQ